MTTPSDGRERALITAWWASFGMIALALISALISLPGAFVVAPWMLVLGVGGLIVLSAVRVHARMTGR